MERTARILLALALVGATAVSVLIPVGPGGAAAAAPKTPLFGSEIDPYPSYSGQSTCDPTPKPGVVAFTQLVLPAYPTTGSYGISRDCAQGGQSEHKEGRAWDWRADSTDPQDLAAVQDLLGWLLATDQYGNAHALARRFGIMYIIWNRQIWRAYRPNDGWQPYTGSNPHIDHVHFSFGWPGAYQTTSYWSQNDGFTPYGIFTGGASTAVGQLVPGGDSETVTGPGAGGGPQINIMTRIGDLYGAYFPYDVGFRGGVWVTTSDVDGNGLSEIVSGPGAGGGPHVRVIEAMNALRVITDFFAFDPSFGGGVRVAAGNFDSDTSSEVVTAAGPGGGPHVRLWNVDAGVVGELAGFFAYAPSFTGGVWVAAGNIDGTGGDELVTGAGPGGGPHVRVFKVSGGSVTEIASFFAYDSKYSGGVRVAVGDVDGDGKAEIVTTPGAGGGPHVRIFAYNGSSIFEKNSFMATSPDMTRGLFPAVGPILDGSTGKIVIGSGAGDLTRIRLREGSGVQVPG